MINKNIFVFFISLFLLHSFASAKPEEAISEYLKIKSCYYEVLKLGTTGIEMQKWTNCIKGYTNFAKKFPTSLKAQAALFSAAELNEALYNQSNINKYLETSLQLYNQIVKDYASSSFADDSLFRVAKLLSEEKKDINEAIVVLEKLTTEYPLSDKFDEALSLKLDLLSQKINTKITYAPKNVVLLNDLKFWSNAADGKISNYSRVVLYFDRKIEYLYQIQTEGNRKKLMIEFDELELNPKVSKEIKVKDNIVNKITIRKNKKSFALDISGTNIKYTVAHFENPFKIVIDCFASTSLADKKRSDENKATEEQDEIKNMLTNYDKIEIKQGKASIKTIVIDPGHGGEDWGAIGSANEKEKSITLTLSRLLANLIQKKLNIRTLLTRNSDIFIDLEARTAYANMEKADLFISIHVNAINNPESKGIEIYYLDNSTNKGTKRLAARENLLINNTLPEANILDYIKKDLTITSDSQESRLLAQTILSDLIENMTKKYKNIVNLGVKCDTFYVLWGATMPSVLIETGFISNKEEVARLGDLVYLEDMAYGIFLGIKNYISSLGPKTVN